LDETKSVLSGGASFKGGIRLGNGSDWVLMDALGFQSGLSGLGFNLLNPVLSTFNGGIRVQNGNATIPTPNKIVFTGTGTGSILDFPTGGVLGKDNVNGPIYFESKPVICRTGSIDMSKAGSTAFHYDVDGDIDLLTFSGDLVGTIAYAYSTHLGSKVIVTETRTFFGRTVTMAYTWSGGVITQVNIS
jgi:hypothetical protein